MTKKLWPQQVITLIGLFNVNVSISNEVESYLASLTIERRNEVKFRMKELTRTQSVTVADIYNITSFQPTDDQTAMNFFTAVYLHAFEGGEEPDIDDYRLEWSI
jgi:hypothetical protein